MSAKLEDYQAFAKRVSYDPETGVFLWLRREGDSRSVNQWNSRLAGKEAGSIESRGYRRISITSISGETVAILFHRLAWLMVYGELPKYHIDHINQQPGDNRIANLRDVTAKVNGKNKRMQKDNRSGINGVSFRKKTGKWRAHCYINGKNTYFGQYATPEEALAVLKEIRAKHGYTENHGASHE